MNIVEHTKYLWQIENIITDQECENFNILFDQLNLSPIDGFRNDVRRNNTFTLEYPGLEEINNLAWSFIMKAHQLYVSKNEWVFLNWNKEELLGPTIKWSGKNIVRVYDPSDLYEWHTDHSPHNLPELSYILYLNDGYVGGETCFMNDNLTVQPKKCSVVCFPVDHYHIHKSNEIISGTKRIIWNCLYRQELTIVERKSKFGSIQGAPRSTKSIW